MKMQTMMLAALAAVSTASAALIDSDTLVYVSFDGTVGSAAATGSNLNLVEGGPAAQLMTVNNAPAATYAEAVSTRISDGVLGTVARANTASLHVPTNGVFSNAADKGDGGTALKISSTDFFSHDFTVEFYFRTDGPIDPATQFGRPELMFCQTGSLYFQLTFNDSAKMLAVCYNTASGTSTYASAAVGTEHAYDDGLWHHVALVHNRTARTLKVFVDHAEKLSKDNMLVDATVTGDLYFGGRANRNMRFLNGWIDEFRFTKRALDESEFLVMEFDADSSSLVRPDTMVYVPFDGRDGAVVETGRNLNVIPGGINASLVRSGNADSAVWSSANMPAVALRDGKAGAFEPNPSYAVFSTNAANKGATVKVAAAKYFDGTSFTAELFFKTSGRMDPNATYDMPNLIDAFHSGLAAGYIQMTFNKPDGKLYAVYNNNGVWAGGTFGNAHEFDDGAWHHLACVYDSAAGTYTVFVDGVNRFTRSNVAIGTAETDPEAIIIGGRQGSSGYTRFFDGAVDAFRFSKAALGPDDFLRRSNAVKGLRVYFR